jgi:hypothetical protein
MHIGRIEGTTRVVGKSQGYLGLPIRDVVINCSVALNAGAAVHVRILGTMHPPIMVTVGEVPEVN